MKNSMMTLNTVFVIAMALAACKDNESPSTTGQSETVKPSTTSAAPKLDAKSEVERGRYIVSTSGCHDCHTPFKVGPNGAAPDMTRALSGHPESLQMPPAPQLPAGPWLVTVAGTNTAWAGPWGVSFTANLTPDPETGLGKWTRQNFIDTIRNGRHMGAGRPLLPPMPFPVYSNLTDEDLGAVFTYLKTVPAISNKVPTPVGPPQVVTTTAGTMPTTKK